MVSPKDKDNITSKGSVIYSYTCGEIDCDEEYIGVSGRTFGERFKEHLKAPSPIFLHQNNSGHETTLNNFRIIGREDNNLARTIKKSMYIRVNNPTLNRNIGKYNLPHIWDKILFSIPGVEEKVNHENNICMGTITSVPHIMHNNISARSYTIKRPE